mmetsp:Transcript_110568/g.319467  ORF Transcript_110568/g.319467 Transcript_110568/m.319467 type:complete len:332 (-) Transcript_110568:856-1851(-)
MFWSPWRPRSPTTAGEAADEVAEEPAGAAPATAAAAAANEEPLQSSSCIVGGFGGTCCNIGGPPVVSKWVTSLPVGSMVMLPLAELDWRITEAPLTWLVRMFGRYECFLHSASNSSRLACRAFRSSCSRKSRTCLGSSASATAVAAVSSASMLAPGGVSIMDSSWSNPMLSNSPSARRLDVEPFNEVIDWLVPRELVLMAILGWKVGCGAFCHNSSRRRRRSMPSRYRRSVTDPLPECTAAKGTLGTNVQVCSCLAWSTSIPNSWYTRRRTRWSLPDLYNRSKISLAFSSDTRGVRRKVGSVSRPSGGPPGLPVDANWPVSASYASITASK